MLATASAVATSVSTRSIFDMLPHHEVFPACLKTVSAAVRHTKSANKTAASIGTEDVELLCERILESAPKGPGRRTTGVMADCAELGGRIEMASTNGYLGDGGEFCGRIVRQSAKENKQPLSEYIPNGKTSRRRFCQQFNEFAEEFGTLCTTNKLWKQEVDPLADEQAVEAEEAQASESERPAQGIVATAAVQHEAMTSEFLRSSFGKILRWGEKGPHMADAIAVDE